MPTCSRQTCVVPTDQTAHSIIVILCQIHFSYPRNYDIISFSAFHLVSVFVCSRFPHALPSPSLPDLPPANPIWASLAWNLLSSPQVLSLNKDAQTDSLVVDVVCRGVRGGTSGDNC